MKFYENIIINANHETSKCVNQKKCLKFYLWQLFNLWIKEFKDITVVCEIIYCWWWIFAK